MMATVRVLWKDAAGEGRFTVVEAGSLAEAAWNVAVSTESRAAVFVEAVFTSDPEG